MTFVDGSVLTAEQLNIFLRDNLNETSPAKATTKGSLFVGNGPNSIVERIPQRAIITAADDTTSTSYTDMATVGPSVTVTTGTRALIVISAHIANNTSNSLSSISYTISGNTVQAATDTNSLFVDGIDADKPTQRMQIQYEEGLSPGENTFTLKYKVGSGRITAQNRFLAVWPF